MIAISENILREYIKFKNGNESTCDFKILEGFFKNFYPFVISIQQLTNIGIEQKTIMTLIQSNKKFDELSTRLVTANTIDELIEKSQLRLLLTHDDGIKSLKYLTINILKNNYEISKKFSGTYEPGVPRHNAIKHIKSLIENSSNIKIFDKHMSWANNFYVNIAILKRVLPLNASVDLYLENEIPMSTAKNDLFRDTLASERADLTVIWHEIDSDMHDRYIEADSIKVLMSSGLFYLKERKKDFTYVVNI